MGEIGNFNYLSSLSGIFRLLTVLLGIPAMTLAWIAYFTSSWTKTFPEIIAILIAEKNVRFPKVRYSNGSILEDTEMDILAGEEGTTTSEASTEKDSSSSSEEFDEYDLITDKEEEALDDILLQTLMYEKFFIGIVSIVFLISLLYLMVRVLTKHQPDSPYEIMFDFIFHVVSALGLLTGGALVLLSAAKIQSFIDQVKNGFAPDIVSKLIDEDKDVQDKADKLAAAIIGMLNGILYALCVVTIRMTEPVGCKSCKSRCTKRGRRNRRMKKLLEHRHRLPIYTVSSMEQHEDESAQYGIYGNQAY